jgi:hypothetical protein
MPLWFLSGFSNDTQHIELISKLLESVTPAKVGAQKKAKNTGL